MAAARSFFGCTTLRHLHHLPLDNGLVSQVVPSGVYPNVIRWDSTHGRMLSGLLHTFVPCSSLCSLSLRRQACLCGFIRPCLLVFGAWCYCERARVMFVLLAYMLGPFGMTIM